MNITARKILICMLLVGAMFAPVLLVQGESGSHWQERQVIVRQGDTVWAIACEYTTTGEDVRMVVERIYKTNKLSHREAIQPGQTILVPVRADSEKMHLAAQI